MSTVKVELENIGVFRERKKFVLSKGLNVLYAPNASGKTSLISSLKAVSIPTLTPEELRRVLNDYEERGRVRLVINGEECIIELVRRPDNTVEALGKRLAENGIIKEVAFVDLENRLVNAIYSGDEEGVEKELREIVGVTFIETVLSSLEGLKAEHDYQYQVKKRNYESKREETLEQCKRLEERLVKVRDRIREIERDSRIEPVRKEIEEIRAEYDKLLKQLEEERRREIEANNRLGLLEHDYTSKKAELEALKERRELKLAELKKLEEALVTARKEIEKLTSEVRKLKEKGHRIEQERKEIEKLIEERRSVLGYAQCPKCGAPVDKDRVLREIAELEEKAVKLREELESVRREIEARESRMLELREQVERRADELKRYVDEVTRTVTKLESEIARIEDSIKSERRVLEEIRKHMEPLEERLLVLDKKLEALKDKVPLVEELRYLQREEQRILEELDYLFGRLRQLDQVYSEVRQLEELIETLLLLIKYFKIRLNELKRVVVERINETVLKHFKLLNLAELEYPVLAEDFTLTLTRVGKIPTNLAELSDAEKAIFAILMTMALKDYVAGDFPFYVVDSIIEFIDDARAREVLRYLMEVGKDKVVVVTKTRPYSGQPAPLSQEDIFVNSIPI